MPNRPFGFDTLDIPAFLSTEGAETLGLDAVEIPAILVPEGGNPPVGDWVNVGVVMHPRQRSGSDATEQPTAPPEQCDRRVGLAVPTTRFRLGTGLPTNHGSRIDPVAVGMKTWRGMATDKPR
ncbi:MAG: hypothetical protein WCI94_23155 [Rhodospirillales bacterium]